VAMQPPVDPLAQSVYAMGEQPLIRYYGSEPTSMELKPD
jgi:hypothetical protein